MSTLCFFPTLSPGDGFRSNDTFELNPFVAQVQSLLNEELGLQGDQRLDEDGYYGDSTVEAVRSAWSYVGKSAQDVFTRELEALLLDAPVPPQAEVAPMLWGALLPFAARQYIQRMMTSFGGATPSDLTCCMAFESGYTFDPSITNGDRVVWNDPSDFRKGYQIKRRSGSTGTGIIQFMGFTAARLLGYSKTKAGRKQAQAHVQSMSLLEQLALADEYFEWQKPQISNARDLYCAIFWPAGVSKSLGYAFDMSARQVLANKGLDTNGDGTITKREATSHIPRLKKQGEQYRG